MGGQRSLPFCFGRFRFLRRRVCFVCGNCLRREYKYSIRMMPKSRLVAHVIPTVTLLKYNFFYLD